MNRPRPVTAAAFLTVAVGLLGLIGAGVNLFANNLMAADFVTFCATRGVDAATCDGHRADYFAAAGPSAVIAVVSGLFLLVGVLFLRGRARVPGVFLLGSGLLCGPSAALIVVAKGPLVEDALAMPGAGGVIPLWFDLVGVTGGVLALAMTVLALVALTRGESRAWFRALSGR